MRISFVEPHLRIFGGIRRILEFSNRFVARGVGVTIYHPTGEECDWMQCDADVATLHDFHATEHDVVIFNNPPDYSHVKRCRARLKVFYILALYERDKLKNFNPKIFWPKKGRMLSLKRCLQLPFFHVANASWMQRWLKNNLNMDVALQLGGINRDVFRPVEVTRDDNAFRILCSGDPRTHKGAATVDAAVEIVRRTYPQVELDSYYGKGIPQSRMAEKYCSADLFVDAQWYAGWNNPVAEALTCGVPVVCSDIGGVADFAVDQETALLVPPKDAQATAGAIERMIRDHDLRNSLSINGLKRMARFDWEEAADQFLEMLARQK